MRDFFTFLLVWTLLSFCAASLWGGWMRNRRRDHERRLHKKLLAQVIR